MMTLFPKYKKEYALEKVHLFTNPNLAKLIELFFTWLTNRKYLCFKLKINEKYNMNEN